MPLTDEQRKIIENSLWVVNTALKKQGLSNDEELRQEAILYMCKCLQRYSKMHMVKWTTYAYKNIFLYIKRVHADEMKRMNSEIITDIIEDFYLSEELKNDEICRSDREIFQDILKACSDDERNILIMKSNGYTYHEISDICNISISKVNSLIKEIKNKAKDIKKYI